MVITQIDSDVFSGTINLDIIDLKFTDFGIYTCVVFLKGGGIFDISIDVNIFSSIGKKYSDDVKGVYIKNNLFAFSRKNSF